MEPIDYYQAKCLALEDFYGWVDQGSPYDIAVAQSFYYDTSEPWERFLMAMTIACRFIRSGRVLPDRTRAYLAGLLEQRDLAQDILSRLPADQVELFREELAEALAVAAPEAPAPGSHRGEDGAR